MPQIVWSFVATKVFYSKNPFRIAQKFRIELAINIGF